MTPPDSVDSLSLSDAVFSPDRTWLASRLLGALPDVRHAVTAKAFARDPAERATLVARLAATLGWRAAAVCLAEQPHGGGVAVVSADDAAAASVETPRVFAGVDALVTAQPGAALAIFTADCVPALFADAQAGVIGAVHAGWRGTMARVLPNALRAAFAIGARPDRVRLWIGPAISGGEYEVSAELAARFAEAFPGHAGATIRGRLLDLSELNRREAVEAGLQPDHITLSGLCTRRLSGELCSHRADADAAGRMAAAILLEQGAPGVSRAPAP